VRTDYKATFYFTIILLAILFFFLNYQQVFSERIVTKNTSTVSFAGKYQSDTPDHIRLLKLYFAGERYIPHPMWHLGTYITSKIAFISIPLAAVIFSTFIMLAWIGVIFFYLQLKFKEQDTKYAKFSIVLLLTLITIIFIGPMLFPKYEYIIYAGKGSPNIWHNITIWMVKPFAFISVIFTVLAINKDRSLFYTIAFIMATLSIFAKPSFIIMFLPSLLLLALIQKIYTKKFFYFFITLSLVSVGILLYQFSNTFGESEVILKPLVVWSLSSRNIAFSILLGLLFPILYTIYTKKNSYDKLYQLVWIQVIIGIIFYALFAQAGVQFVHANFSWSYMIAMNFIYIISITSFVLEYKSISIYPRTILSVVLFLQFSIGVYYFYKILLGQNPLYISMMFLR